MKPYLRMGDGEMRGSLTKLNTVSRCLRKAYFAYERNLTRAVKPIAPTRGILGHDCLSNLYSGKDWQAPIQQVSIDLSKVFEEEREDYANLPGDMFRIMRGYLLTYKGDKNWKIHAVEQDFCVPTPGGNELEGRIDLIFEDDIGLWVMDHKFVSQIPDDSVRFMDAQTALYDYAARQLGYKPVGVVFNYIRTKAPTVPKLLKNGTMSRAKIDTDAATYMQALRENGLDPGDYAEFLGTLSSRSFYSRFMLPQPGNLVDSTLEDFDNWMAVYESARKSCRFPRAVSKNCSWDCEFYRICQAELTGADPSYLIETYYTERRKEDAEDE